MLRLKAAALAGQASACLLDGEPARAWRAWPLGRAAEAPPEALDVCGSLWSPRRLNTPASHSMKVKDRTIPQLCGYRGHTPLIIVFTSYEEERMKFTPMPKEMRDPTGTC